MEFEKVDGISVARPSTEGGVLAFTEPWAAEVVRLAESADPPLIAVDLGGTPKLHPRVMAGLIQASRKLKARGGRLAFFAVAAPMNDIMQVMGLAKEVLICADLPAAVQALKPDATPAPEATPPA